MNSVNLLLLIVNMSIHIHANVSAFFFINQSANQKSLPDVGYLLVDELSLRYIHCEDSDT